jgi:excisionase family DNA binding protein
MKLTPKQAAERAGVSLSLIYQLCEERRLTHYRIGGRGKRGKILIAPDDLDAFLESLRVEPPEAPDPEEAAYQRHLR